MSNVLMDISFHADAQHRAVLPVYTRNDQRLKTYYLKQSLGEMSGEDCRLLSTIRCEWWNRATGFAIPGLLLVSHEALPTMQQRLLMILDFFSSRVLRSLGGATCVSQFGMADWLNRLRAFIFYTVLLIKKKKWKKLSVASAASSVALHGLPLRSRSLRAEDRIQKQK